MPRYNNPRKAWEYSKDFKVEAVRLTYTEGVQLIGFIEQFGSVLGVRYLCKWLGVSKSGYYDWCKREPSN